MKKIITILSIGLFSFSAYSIGNIQAMDNVSGADLNTPEFITSNDLIVLDIRTGDARQLLVRGSAANKIYESLVNQGNEEELSEKLHRVSGGKISCNKYLESGRVFKELCSIGIK